MVTAYSERNSNVSRWRAAVREMWGQMAAMGPHNHGHWPALRVGLCVSVPILTVVLLGRTDLAAYVSFGAINSVYGKHLDYAERFRAQMVTGLTLSAAVLAGTVIGVVSPGSWLALGGMAAFSALGYAMVRRSGWLPNPALFLVFALGTLSSYRHVWGDVVPAALLSLIAAAFALVVGQLGRFRSAYRPRQKSGAAVAPVAMDDVVLHALAPALAGGSALVMGFGHSYWAAVTATVPLVGARFAHQVARGALRMAGTVAGVGLAGLLIQASTPAWQLCLYVAVLQVLTELFVARNYGIAVIAITAMALIMSHLGAPGAIAPLLSDRLLETALGVGVAVLVVALRRVKNHSVATPRPPAASGKPGK